MTPESVCLLYDYTYWAFERLWACVSALSDAQFTQHVDYSMGSIRHHVVHLMSGTQRWIARLQGSEVPPHLAFDNYPTLEAAKATWDEMKVRVLDYVASLDQAHLDEVVHWEVPTRGVSCTNHRWEILLHVANHATDHRAQILSVLHHHFGTATVEQDLVFYLLHGADDRKP